MEERIREESWGKILDGESGADYLINEQIDKSFSDKNDLLNWRNGGFDKEKFKNNSKSFFQDEISDIYDDFDDQVDKKSGIK